MFLVYILSYFLAQGIISFTITLSLCFSKKITHSVISAGNIRLSALTGGLNFLNIGVSVIPG